MSKRENHWYFVGNLVGAFATTRPTTKKSVLWLGLFLTIWLGVRQGWFGFLDSMDPAARRLVPLALFVAIAPVIWLLRNARVQSARASYLKCLLQPGPERLVSSLSPSPRDISANTDLSAAAAYARAIAYALYGRGDDALHTLSEIDWKTKAPSVQALGLSSEGITELLCYRDAHRALALNREASDLAAISSLVPGAAQTARFHATCVAVSEAILHTESPTSVQHLQESSKDNRYPPVQLLACFGLAIVLERSCDQSGAERLRQHIRFLAPFCKPLQLAPEEFLKTETVPEHPSPVGDGVSSFSFAGQEGTQERLTKQRVLSAVIWKLGTWVALALACLALWAFAAMASK